MPEKNLPTKTPTFGRLGIAENASESKIIVYIKKKSPRPPTASW